MAEQHRFLISFITSNQPQSIEVSVDSDTLSTDEAKPLIQKALKQPTEEITDIQVVGVHHANNPDVHPGHYQQPEG